jgi:hypothetical protein
MSGTSGIEPVARRRCVALTGLGSGWTPGFTGLGSGWTPGSRGVAPGWFVWAPSGQGPRVPGALPRAGLSGPLRGKDQGARSPGSVPGALPRAGLSGPLRGKDQGFPGRCPGLDCLGPFGARTKRPIPRLGSRGVAPGWIVWAPSGQGTNAPDPRSGFPGRCPELIPRPRSRGVAPGWIVWAPSGQGTPPDHPLPRESDRPALPGSRSLGAVPASMLLVMMAADER